MHYKLFGNSGLRVSELALGAWGFGQIINWSTGEKQSREIFDLFVEAGGNFIDTANYYNQGESESYIGEWVAGNRESFVLSTKYTMSMNTANPNAGGNHRKCMFESLHASLKRLKTDYIDIYWVHAWDQVTPVEETIRALDDMVRSGKVLYIGASDMPAWLVSRANTMAELRGWTPFNGLQLEYSLIERSIEKDSTPMAETMGMAITAWSPLAMGFLTGKYKDGIPDESRFAKNDYFQELYFSERNSRIVEEVVSIAGEIGCPPSQVALNWLRQRKGNIIPIIGAKTADQLQENLGCLNFMLEVDHLKRLDEVSKVSLGFPEDFLQRPGLKSTIHGEFADKILIPSPVNKSILGITYA